MRQGEREEQITLGDKQRSEFILCWQILANAIFIWDIIFICCDTETISKHSGKIFIYLTAPTEGEEEEEERGIRSDENEIQISLWLFCGKREDNKIGWTFINFPLGEMVMR